MIIKRPLQVVGNLRNLDLSGNKIKLLPENIGSFKMLKTLTMSKNQLDSIPQVKKTSLKIFQKFVIIEH